jgi:hypothetical protein
MSESWNMELHVCIHPYNIFLKFYVYWTVHHLDIWIKINYCFSLHKDTTPPQPNHTVTPTHIEPEQYNTWNKSAISRKLLKMDVLTFETCWALNDEIIKQVTSSWSIFLKIERELFLASVSAPLSLPLQCKRSQCAPQYVKYAFSASYWLFKTYLLQY